jgi:hypothetical protein
LTLTVLLTLNSILFCPLIGDWLDQSWYISTMEYYAIVKTERPPYMLMWNDFQQMLLKWKSRRKYACYCLRKRSICVYRCVFSCRSKSRRKSQNIKNKQINWAWWYIPVISALRRLWQEEQEFKSRLG